jgi:hypothetical protein
MTVLVIALRTSFRKLRPSEPSFKTNNTVKTSRVCSESEAIDIAIQSWSCSTFANLDLTRELARRGHRDRGVLQPDKPVRLGHLPHNHRQDFQRSEKVSVENGARERTDTLDCTHCAHESISI